MKLSWKEARNMFRFAFGFLAVLASFASITPTHAQQPTAIVATPQVEVGEVRRVFDNGEHNAFTDLIRFGDHYYLTFRSCPDGHMVHPSSSIVILRSDDCLQWEQVHRFNVPLRDTRDPHVLEFKGQLFVYTGTWYSGETTLDRADYDLNKHLGYAVASGDGSSWSAPKLLEGTFGHYIWRAQKHGELAYLCGRRKQNFAMRPRGEGTDVESAMLVSEDGWVWKTHALFQETQGDETAFQFEADGTLLGVARRGSGPAELLRSPPPYSDWQRTDLDRYIGGPLIIQWGERWVVGGRKSTPAGPKTALYWLTDGQLKQFAELPSGGDNSYPGFLAMSDTRAVVSWYSTHETNADGSSMTAIYLADLSIPTPQPPGPGRSKISFTSSYDGSLQAAYLTQPNQPQTNHSTSAESATPAPDAPLMPLVVSLHSWSGDLEQRNVDLEQRVAERGWFCLQPNFRGVNEHPLACASLAAQQDILDAIDWVQQKHAIDPQRIYLTGESGGGHMTLMMAARYPERWTAASAWVGISDLAAWHAKHAEGRYGAMVRACCGGAPGDNPQVDEQYSLRSPLTFMTSAKDVAIDISAGIHDGHLGSVPIRHSLDAFNLIAEANQSPVISEQEISQLSRRDGRLNKPGKSDLGFDPTFAREFYLRRHANRARVTIFEGGHEGIASATMAWFDAHPTREK